MGLADVVQVQGSQLAAVKATLFKLVAAQLVMVLAVSLVLRQPVVLASIAHGVQGGCRVIHGGGVRVWVGGWVVEGRGRACVCMHVSCHAAAFVQLLSCWRFFLTVHTVDCFQHLLLPCIFSIHGSHRNLSFTSSTIPTHFLLSGNKTVWPMPKSNMALVVSAPASMCVNDLPNCPTVPDCSGHAGRSGPCGSVGKEGTCAEGSHSHCGGGLGC